MRVLGIVPARKGSKRLVGKNTRLLGGKPLCEWALEAALGAKRIDRLVVSSDDEAVLEIARRHDPRLPLPRPDELAGDLSPSVDYVFHALEALKDEGPFDAVAIMPSSSPLTLSSDIDATIELLEKTGAETAVSVMKLDHSVQPIKMKRMEGDRLIPYLEEENGRMAAHELPTLYVRNCGVYASRREVYYKYRSIVGRDMRGYVMPPERSVDINIEMDLLMAGLLLERSGRAPRSL